MCGLMNERKLRHEPLKCKSETFAPKEPHIFEPAIRVLAGDVTMGI